MISKHNTIYNESGGIAKARNGTIFNESASMAKTRRDASISKRYLIKTKHVMQLKMTPISHSTPLGQKNADKNHLRRPFNTGK